MGTFPVIALLAIGFLLTCSVLGYAVFVLRERILALEKALCEVDKSILTTTVFFKNILLTSVVTQQGVNTLLSLLSKKDGVVNQDEGQKEGIKIH